LDTINSNKEIKEIIAIRKLDKDGYRSGGKIKATIEKYKRLLSLLQEALKIKDSQSIEKTQDFIKEKILNIG
jgi:DNA-binding ferritin-like protein